MKKGELIKSAKPTEQELELVNSFARKTLGEDEVYVFSVVLCDNEVDRDFERFPVESLEKLSALFVGKTGIFDHNPSAKNQAARIISCRVEQAEGKTNTLGDPLFRLVARAYMPALDSNRELRDSIDSGILREVSVGCAVEKTVCSICGEELCSCSHQKGKTYGGKLCFGELLNPTDAYEFSFVAVPAQKGAGVIKNFGKEVPMTDILKTIEKGGELSLSEKDSEKLCSYIKSLKSQAADGILYRSGLEKELLRLSAICEPKLSFETMKEVSSSISSERLLELVKHFRAKAEKSSVPTPQLFSGTADAKNQNNTEFKI